MKAIINKSDLLKHQRILKVGRPSKSLAGKISVEINISKDLSVIGPGFEDRIDCEVLKWGTAIAPFLKELLFSVAKNNTLAKTPTITLVCAEAVSNSFSQNTVTIDTKLIFSYIFPLRKGVFLTPSQQRRYRP
jgi:hypothetical protein